MSIELHFVHERRREDTDRHPWSDRTGVVMLVEFDPKSYKSCASRLIRRSNSFSRQEHQIVFKEEPQGRVDSRERHYAVRFKFVGNP